MKFVIPNVDLKKFYKLCAFQNISAKDIRLNEKTIKSYKKFRDYLYGGSIKAESYAIFIEKLRKRILSKIISKEDLSQLDNRPLPLTLDFKPILVNSYMSRRLKQLLDVN